MQTQTECPICAPKSLSEFLCRKRVPTNQNLLMRDQASSLGVSRGDLALTVCEDCGFVFNRAFDLRKLIYGEDYENTQACSPLFSEYMDGLGWRIVVKRNVRDSSIVEIALGESDSSLRNPSARLPRITTLLIGVWSFSIASSFMIELFMSAMPFPKVRARG